MLTFIGPEPSLPISHTVIKTAIWDWACKQHNKCWQDIRTCRQTKEMIKDRCRRRESDLLRLPRQTLRLVIGVLTGHACLNRHLSIIDNKGCYSKARMPIDHTASSKKCSAVSLVDSNIRLHTFLQFLVEGASKKIWCLKWAF